MYDRISILNLIEDAERASPFCACGARMIPVERGGALWLECAGRQEPRAVLLARLVSLDWLVGHDRHIILDEPAARAA